MLAQAASCSDTSALAIRLASPLLGVVTNTMISWLTAFLYHDVRPMSDKLQFVDVIGSDDKLKFVGRLWDMLSERRLTPRPLRFELRNCRAVRSLPS